MDKDTREEAIDYGDAEDAYSDEPADAPADEANEGPAAMEEEPAAGSQDGADGAAPDANGSSEAPAAENGGGAAGAAAKGTEGADGAAAEPKGEQQGQQDGGGAVVSWEDRDPMKLPPHGTEVFVANLPHEAPEDKVREFVAATGFKIHSVRVPRPGGDTRGSQNKGFAFAVFFTKEDAAAAVEKMNGQTMGDRTIRASISTTNNRLFIGNIPRTMTGAQLKEAMSKEVQGLEEVDLVADRENPEQNRGFGFLSFYNHDAAEKARRRLEAGFSVGMRPVSVTWAEPKRPEDHTIRSVYVAGLPQEAKTEDIKDLFQQYGEVEDVTLLQSKEDPSRIRDYCFVHYKERAAALKAIEQSQADKPKLGDKELVVSLAKPPSQQHPGQQGYAYGGRGTQGHGHSGGRGGYGGRGGGRGGGGGYEEGGGGGYGGGGGGGGYGCGDCQRGYGPRRRRRW